MFKKKNQTNKINGRCGETKLCKVLVTALRLRSIILIRQFYIFHLALSPQSIFRLQFSISKPRDTSAFESLFITDCLLGQGIGPRRETAILSYPLKFVRNVSRYNLFSINLSISLFHVLSGLPLRQHPWKIHLKLLVVLVSSFL